LIYGRAGSGKSSMVTEKIAELVAGGKQVILMVPEQFTHIAERQLLKKIGHMSRQTVEVLSFATLAKRALSENGTVAKTLGKAGRSIVLARVLDGIELKYFTRAQSTGGFVDTCLHLIEEFKQYGVTVQELRDAAEKEESERLRWKLEDLVAVFEAYEERTRDGYMDAEDIMHMLPDMLRKSDSYRDTVFFMDEYTGFLPQEFSVICALAQTAPQVWITLCTEEPFSDLPVFLPTVTTAGKLKKMCEENGIAFLPPVAASGGIKHSGAIAFLEQNLYARTPRVHIGTPEGICIHAAANPFSEVEHVARQIVALCRERGYRYREIGVICADLAGYGQTVKNIFENYGIRCFMDRRAAVMDHHLIRFVLCALDIYLENYSFDTVFYFLKSGFSDVAIEDVFLLENYVASAGIRRSAWVNDEKWNYLLDRKMGDETEFLERINSIRQRFIRPLAAFHDAIKGRHTVAHMTEQLYRYLLKIALPQTIGEYIERFRKAGETARVKEYEKIWGIITEVMDELVTVAGEDTVNVSQFRALLQTALCQHSVGLIPTSLDEVLVGDVKRTRLSGCRALFVLGVNDGLFPQSASGEDVLTDAEKEHLAAGGMELSTTTRLQAFLDQFLIYAALTLPSERLYLSYAQADAAFHALRPSFLLARLKRIMPKITQTGEMRITEENEEQLGFVCGVKPTLSQLTDRMNEGRMTPFWRDVYRYFDKEEKALLAQAVARTEFTNLPQKLDADKVSAFMGEEVYTTISRLQRYRSCRYSYFLEYMLGLREREQFSLGALDIGSFVHSVLERVCVGMQGKGLSFAQADDEYLLREIDRYIAEFVEGLRTRTAELKERDIYTVKRLRSTLLLCFQMLKMHITQSGFVPMGYEIRFDDKNVGCITIPVGNGKKVKITGVIDRADAYETDEGTFVRVVDYKTGAKTFKLDDVFYGLDIQLMVYLDALVESKAEYRYGGALYFRVDDPILGVDNHGEGEGAREKIFSALKMRGLLAGEVIPATDPITANRAKTATLEDFSNLNKHLKKLVGKLCSSLVGGQIDLHPFYRGNTSPCAYCAYGSVCGFDVRREGNRYDYLPTLKDEQVWEKIGGEADVD